MRRHGVLAITGGTGFVGGHLIGQAVAAGYTVRALARRPQEPVAGVTWVPGALDRPETLAALVRGADAVIHVAGVINATDRAGFAAGNVAGTMAIAAAARDAGIDRFIHVSSLSAREPDLSDYGWSKRRSEQVLGATLLDWSAIRPPAIYGPGDREVLEFFRFARRGFVPLPPDGRLSVISAEDLCRLLLAAVETRDATGAIWEPDDGRAGGWSHREFATALGSAVGRPVRPVPLSAGLLRAGAAADGLVRRGQAKLTPDRVRYFCHPDWVASPQRHPPPALWRASVPTVAGLRATAAWYRKEGWL